MAQGRRVERMASLIRREVSQMLMGGIKDERVSHGLVSVTSVEVAGDLQHCKIFVSVFGSADDQSQAMEGLASASSFVKGELGRRLKMRRTPELVFVLDRGFERSANVLGILHQLEQKRLEKGDLGTEADAGNDEAVEADELDEENTDYDEAADEADDEGEDEEEDVKDDEDYEGDDEDMDEEFEEEDEFEFENEEEVEDGDDQADDDGTDDQEAENSDTKTP
jgi:ribosome-binding factor A